MRGDRLGIRRVPVALLALATAAGAQLAAAADGDGGARAARPAFPPAKSLRTTTPIKHLVLLIPENESFDHYFGTYPKAENLPGEVPFKAKPGTPRVEGLSRRLREDNPNLVNPYRLAPRWVLPCVPDHFMPEQEAAINRGHMNRFVQESGDMCPAGEREWPMAYFDGNTVTAHWNYAQRFAMSDAFHADVLGPSTPGHLNLIAGQTHGALPGNWKKRGVQYSIRGTMVNDPDPAGDDCSTLWPRLSMSGRNIGDLLNERRVSWGYFQRGFAPTSRLDGEAVCGRSHHKAAGNLPDYVAHHEPFQYYDQTANPHHRRPSSTRMIGSTDRANHQYDIKSFWDAAEKGNQPAVSFLKPPAWADSHAGYSNPLAERRWLVKKINRLQRLDTWRSTAILIVYDDSGGWYDHVEPPLRSESRLEGFDSLTGPGRCGTPGPGAYQGRCGLGMRMPFIVISRYARSNYVDHRVLQQSSVLRFIEDNWKLGRLGDQSFDADAASIEPLFGWNRHTRKLILDPHTGAPVR
jgi:phospholipase C